MTAAFFGTAPTFLGDAAAFLAGEADATFFAGAALTAFVLAAVFGAALMGAFLAGAAFAAFTGAAFLAGAAAGYRHLDESFMIGFPRLQFGVLPFFGAAAFFDAAGAGDAFLATTGVAAVFFTATFLGAFFSEAVSLKEALTFTNFPESTPLASAVRSRCWANLMDGWLEVMYALMAWEDEPVLSLRPAMASLASSRYDFFGAAADMIPVQYFQDEKKSDSEFALEREVA